MIEQIAISILLVEGILVSIIIICCLLHIVWRVVNRTKNECTWYVDYLKFRREYEAYRKRKELEDTKPQTQKMGQ